MKKSFTMEKARNKRGKNPSKTSKEKSGIQIESINSWLPFPGLFDGNYVKPALETQINKSELTAKYRSPSPSNFEKSESNTEYRSVSYGFYGDYTEGELELCPHCKQLWPRDTMYEHMKSCPEDYYECDLCLEKVLVKDRDTHFNTQCKMVLKERISPDFYECPLCGETLPETDKVSHESFSCKTLLHNNEGPLYTLPDERASRKYVPETYQKNVVKPKVAKCSYCKTTLNDNILLFHEKECVYQPTKCPDCSATMLLKDADSHFCKPAKENNKVSEIDLLSKNLKDLFTDENCWDTVLQVGSKEFKAHRTILIARSSVFSAMFQHDTSEKQTGLIKVPDCDPDTFKEFLEYLYCGKLENISSNCALHLYTISDKYNVQELKSFCVKYLMQNITTENICEVAILADMYDETELFSAVQEFFNKNFKEIVMNSVWEDLFKKNFRLANKLLIGKAKVE